MTSPPSDSRRRRDRAVQDLEAIREQPYEEFEDFHRWALAVAEDPAPTAPWGGGV